MLLHELIMAIKKKGDEDKEAYNTPMRVYVGRYFRGPYVFFHFKDTRYPSNVTHHIEARRYHEEIGKWCCVMAQLSSQSVRLAKTSILREAFKAMQCEIDYLFTAQKVEIEKGKDDKEYTHRSREIICNICGGRINVCWTEDLEVLPSDWETGL